MILHPKDRITPTQTALTVAHFTIGVSILVLPRIVVDKSGTSDAWISVLLGGFLSLFFGYVAAKLSQQFPGQTFYQYNQIIAGRFIGTILSIALIIYFILITGYQVRILGETIRLHVLEKTPIEVVSIAFISAATS
ncbi:GerAB/ArcD/ProY family transporter [Aneurinibacillus thermoaerophilus]|uniref:Spore germination protein n=1 Tax=Aneurinibacillus thermoaerophilus TaxID=143495 RepID=A0A1G7YMH9_ANETH|nr:GerAB/ArcD/ProY family transporter [Aneurinibacillus thermoaerophilus]MED0676637.1 GerAB/ArcD/ProY family transporter [Aneurinibacillus thermoaerophilus]MED0738053.1 GerAB/ArcD/ProY family transporter [Aneurinibacillus thermoaerophilus]MED0756474.1 GerAB/ArcD/ProY family transporter [Aneurinibacillus thermoaerophilus]MED0761127.1 GerAB/ArcD/ProY family transporter [Aneurinibacillus thermoaerophilus]SDG97594.1 Spore germination protein [Aneurinibacillus thermoaerophilus]